MSRSSSPTEENESPFSPLSHDIQTTNVTYMDTDDLPLPAATTDQHTSRIPTEAEIRQTATLAFNAINSAHCLSDVDQAYVRCCLNPKENIALEKSLNTLMLKQAASAAAHVFHLFRALKPYKKANTGKPPAIYAPVDGHKPIAASKLLKRLEGEHSTTFSMTELQALKLIFNESLPLVAAFDMDIIRTKQKMSDAEQKKCRYQINITTSKDNGLIMHVTDTSKPTPRAAMKIR